MLPDEPRKYPPLQADSPLVGDPKQFCPGCKQQFVEGDIVTIVVIGPGDDPEARRAHREGLAYTAVGVAAHYACVTGEDDQPQPKG